MGAPRLTPVQTYLAMRQPVRSPNRCIFATLEPSGRLTRRIVKPGPGRGWALASAGAQNLGGAGILAGATPTPHLDSSRDLQAGRRGTALSGPCPERTRMGRDTTPPGPARPADHHEERARSAH